MPPPLDLGACLVDLTDVSAALAYAEGDPMSPLDPPSLPLDPHACYLPQQLAAYLQVSEATLETWRRRGGGPEYLKLKSGRIRYEGSAVLEWLRSRRRRTTSAADEGHPGRSARGVAERTT